MISRAKPRELACSITIEPKLFRAGPYVLLFQLSSTRTRAGRRATVGPVPWEGKREGLQDHVERLEERGAVRVGGEDERGDEQEDDERCNLLEEVAAD